MFVGLAPILLFVIVLFSIGCGYLYLVYSRAHQREAKLHLAHLQESWEETLTEGDLRENAANNRSLINLKGPFAEAGIFDAKEVIEFKKKQRAAVVWGALLGLVIGVVVTGGKFQGVFFGLLLGISVGYLYSERMLRKQKEEFNRELVFFLPIVMERLVMAVQAGLDIIPAMQTIAGDTDQRSQDPREPVSQRELLAPSKQDAVSKLLAIVIRLCDAGLPFEQALREVTSRIDSTAIKHSFIHLAVAHKEGGELVAPLRELSDATQLYFQETVEEDIAVMPVKATMPLLVTFAGLLIIFITSPVLQVSSFMKSANPASITKANHTTRR